MFAMNWQYRKLKTLNHQKALYWSHHDFALTCLHNNINPHGLLTKKPMKVLNISSLMKSFQKDWNTVLMKASQIFLKLLKTYYRDTLLMLENEIAHLDTSLQKDVNHRFHLAKINHYAKRLGRPCDERKKRKLKRLLKEHRRTKRVRGWRNKRIRKNIVNTQSPPPQSDHGRTVVNISDVPLSTAEEDLLSRGLWFCPKPSAVDQFQREEDLHHFFRRLRLKELFSKRRVKMSNTALFIINQNGPHPQKGT